MKYHFFHKWQKEKCDCICDTLIFNRNTTVSVFIFEELPLISNSLKVVCMMSASLYFWFIPLVLTHSLFFASSPFTKRVYGRDVLPGASAPDAVGCRGCVGRTDLHGSWMPSTALRLDLVSYENKADLLPYNSTLTLMRDVSKCFF